VQEAKLFYPMQLGFFKNAKQLGCRVTTNRNTECRNDWLRDQFITWSYSALMLMPQDELKKTDLKA
jgi:hypothetical protein